MVVIRRQPNGDEDRPPVVRQERAVGERLEPRYSEPESIKPPVEQPDRPVRRPRSEDDGPEDDRKRRPDRRRRRRPPPPPPRRGCLENCALFGGLSLLLLTAVFACLALVLTIEVADFLRDPVDNFLGIFGLNDDSPPRVIESETIVLGIQEMAVLQTVSGDIEVRERVLDEGPGVFLDVLDAEMWVSYVGRVTIGIDLALITEDDITTNEDGSLSVKLPPTQVTGCYLGKPQIISKDCPVGRDCGDIVEESYDEAWDQAIPKLLDKAYELDLLGLAYDTAEAQIYYLLHKLGYEVEIQFVRSDEQLPPHASCTPGS